MSEKDSDIEPAGRSMGLVARLTTTARNVSEVVRFGGLETGEAPSPYTVESEHRDYRLRHYFADDVAEGATPILLIPPLMLTTEVWDVSPRSSAVGSLHESGLDTWVVDFGHPDRDPGGLERDITDHVLAISEAIDTVRERTGQDVILAGYSQGGMFAYQTAAFRRNKGIDSLVTFGSPVDASAPLPIPLSPEAASRLANTLIDSGLFRKVAVPGWFSRTGFKMLTPAKSVQDRVKYLLTLHDRDALLPRERQRRFLENEGWTAWSGPAVAQFLEMYFQHNRMLEGGFVIDDRLVSLADIDLPVLTVVGSTDTIGHPDAVRAIRRAAPSAQVYELTLRAGHFGLVVGSTAMGHSWPAVAEWARWRRGELDLPDTIVPADQVPAASLRPSGSGGAGVLTQVTELGVGASKLVVDTARRVSRMARSVVSEAPAQMPRLQRIEQLSPRTRISLGLLLDEQARRNSSEICFLFGDRAHRQSEVKHRVDSIVKGLIEIGIEPGDTVGVLMSTRPSAFTVVAALSRLGATAAVLRPDGDLGREARLARIDRVISDPEHADAVSGSTTVRCYVLGGGADERKLPDGAVDMERIDPDDVTVPDWYRPNPQRAQDIAFVLFTGEGKTTKAIRISNKRWAMSALGTASAAALRTGDTVYSVTPLHHSSALLMSIGGAVAGGARFAIALADDPDTFWEEVRRYGATHVSYTWTSLRAVIAAPQHPNERYHPIRMFIGSGMPRNLWKRVGERFPDAKVLEFYASAEGEAILANLTGQKPGSMGRPLPGTPEVRVAAFGLTDRRLKHTSDGFARETLADEIGLLLSRAQPVDGGSALQRDVFAPGDAWRSTGDLFLRDEQGDHWLAGSVADIIETADGPVLPSGTRFCLNTIDAVDLIVAYGVREGDADVVVGAVTLQPDAGLTAADLDEAMGRLPKRQRPRYVQVVKTIPLTTWHRPIWRELAKRGVPTPTRTRTVFAFDRESGHYRKL